MRIGFQRRVPSPSMSAWIVSPSATKIVLAVQKWQRGKPPPGRQGPVRACAGAAIKNNASSAASMAKRGRATALCVGGELGPLEGAEGHRIAQRLGGWDRVLPRPARLAREQIRRARLEQLLGHLALVSPLSLE